MLVSTGTWHPRPLGDVSHQKKPPFRGGFFAFTRWMVPGTHTTYSAAFKLRRSILYGYLAPSRT